MSRRKSGLNFYQKEKKSNSAFLHELVSWIFSIFVVVFVAIATVYFFGMRSNVIGVSMEPQLKAQQEVLINRVSYVFSTPKVGDVVLFLPNGNVNAHYYTKRVVAVPGDTVQIIAGTLYRNGSPSEVLRAEISDPGIAVNEILLENGEYFVMGDAPLGSEDSRSANIGPVHIDDIVGKVWYRCKNSSAEGGLVK